MGIQLRILGPLELLRDGSAVQPTSAKQRLLLAVLVVHANEVVSVDALVEALWRGRPPVTGPGVLQTYVSQLRKVIEPGLSRRDHPLVLLTVEPGYSLVVGSDDLDAARFERLLALGRAAVRDKKPAVAAEFLREGLGLWRGSALADVADEEPVRAEAQRLDALRVEAVEERLAADIALGRHSELIGELTQLVAAHPLRERLWAQLMLCLYRVGRQGEALASYQQLRHQLADQLGLDPSAELRRLENDILTHAPSLDWSSPEGLADPSGAAAILRGLDWGSPIETTATRRHQFPAALTGFVGRVDELPQVVTLLSASRLLTLTGAGGIGKTRLAVETARRASSDFPDGTWVVELAAVADEAGVIGALTSVVGVTVTGVDDHDAVLAQVAQYLAARHALLVVDNCEHLIAAAARTVAHLLTACPRLTILATSREVLRVPGEVVYPVAPLGLPPEHSADLQALEGSDAVTLFCDRLREVQPTFRLTDTDAAPIARICRRLDGIPLALELAAARARAMTLSQIAARLNDSFALSRGGARTALPRQQTLRAAIDWSYYLLSPAERQAFNRLAVFPERFALEAASFVAADTASGDQIEVIEQLIDKSLVVADGADAEVRLRLLEPVRAYAAERLAAVGDETTARRRHRDYFLGLIDSWWFDLLEATTLRAIPNWANVAAAIEWSLDIGDVAAALRMAPCQGHARVLGRVLEARRRLERTVAAREPTNRPGAERALGVLAMFVQESAQPDQARSRALVDEALMWAARADAADQAFVNYSVSEVMLARGDTEQARRRAEEAIDWYTQAGRDDSLGWCHERLGWVDVADSDYTSGRAHFEQAAVLAERTGDTWLSAHVLAALAPLRVLTGDAESGIDAANDALTLARRVGRDSLLILTLVRSAEAAILANRADQAASVGRELLELVRDQPDRRFVADALEIAALVMENHDDTVAGRLLEAAVTMRLSSGEQHARGRSLAPLVAALQARLSVNSHPSGNGPSMSDAITLARTALA